MDDSDEIPEVEGIERVGEIRVEEDGTTTAERISRNLAGVGVHPAQLRSLITNVVTFFSDFYHGSVQPPPTPSLVRLLLLATLPINLNRIIFITRTGTRF